MAGGRRVGDVERAERINAAAELVEAGVPVAEVARVLAGRFGCSVRQARRYAERAAGGGRAPVPEATVVFTVKLPAELAGRVRQHAHEAGVTVSAVVARALSEFLEHRRRRRR